MVLIRILLTLLALFSFAGLLIVLYIKLADTMEDAANIPLEDDEFDDSH